MKTHIGFKCTGLRLAALALGLSAALVRAGGVPVIDAAAIAQAVLEYTQLIEQYAMSVSRWVQCETCISEYGFLAKHPTTGAAITSPYVTMSQNYLKQVNQCWYQIYQIVRENCSAAYGASPQDDLLERLLTARKGKA